MQPVGHLLILILYFHLCLLVESAGNGSVQLTRQSPQQTPCPGEEVVYVCTVPGNELRWDISIEPGERILDSTSTEVDQNGFRSTPGVYDATNDCFNSTLTFSAQNGTSFICLNHDRSIREPVTVAVQENNDEQCVTMPTPTSTPVPIPSTLSSPTLTQPPTQTQPPTTTSSPSNAGAIAGGVIGGIGVALIVQCCFSKGFVLSV